MNLEILKNIPAETGGHSRGACESCGFYLWSKSGYRIPDLKGLFCSIACIECAVTEKTRRRKKIPAAPIGSGARLLAYLKTVAPEIYARLAQGLPPADSRKCLECGTPLRGKRADSEFCNPAHRMRFRRKSRTSQNREISANMLIGKQGLTEVENTSWTLGPHQASEAVPAALNENSQLSEMSAMRGRLRSVDTSKVYK